MGMPWANLALPGLRSTGSVGLYPQEDFKFIDLLGQEHHSPAARIEFVRNDYLDKMAHTVCTAKVIKRYVK